MKAFLIFLITVGSSWALAEDSCPNFQGDYVASCPLQGRPYSITRLFQPDCRTFGIQGISFLADGTVNGGYGPVRWEPIGSGKLLEREDKDYAYVKEKFFDQDSLYSYSYKVDKVAHEAVMTRVEVIDLLREGNIFVSYEGLGSGTLFNLKNCK